jgi:hypothetical protein
MAGLVEVLEAVAKPNVYPSAGARASSAAPITPPPPALLSTTTACPSNLPKGSATIRAIKSVVPPAAKGTIKRMGLLG